MPTTLPTPERSKIPKTMGVLLIIFASIYMIYSLFGAVTSLMTDNLTGFFATILSASPEFKKAGIDWNSAVSVLNPIFQAQGLSRLCAALISAFALFAAIKLVQYRAEGVKFSIAWAIAALVYLVLDALVYIFYISPIVVKFVTKFSEQLKPFVAPEEGASIEALSTLVTGMGITSLTVTAVIMAVFPLLTLILLKTEGVKKACD